MSHRATAEDTAPPPSRWLHRAALATACLVFPLIFVGAGVTSNDAGMAFPDAPTSNGAWINPDGGAWLRDTQKLWEHGHRLIGWTVGVSAIAGAALSLKSGRRSAARLLCPLVLAAIIAQGVMGWKRVWDVSTAWAMMHGIFGQVCFCMAAMAALVTSRAWVEARPVPPASGTAFLRRLCVFATVAVFLQLVLGAALRHFGGGHAVVAHVLWAIVVVFVIGWSAMWVLGQFPGDRLVTPAARALGILGAIQLILGGAAWLVTLGPDTQMGALTWIAPTAHVAVGALVLVSSVLLTIGVYRVAPAGESSLRAARAPLTA